MAYGFRVRGYRYTHSLKTEGCHDAEFIVIGGTEGCRYENRSTLLPMTTIWRYDNFRFSMSLTVGGLVQ